MPFRNEARNFIRNEAIVNSKYSEIEKIGDRFTLSDYLKLYTGKDDEGEVLSLKTSLNLINTYYVQGVYNYIEELKVRKREEFMKQKVR